MNLAIKVGFDLTPMPGNTRHSIKIYGKKTRQKKPVLPDYALIACVYVGLTALVNE